jgi:hypothetical protein
MSMIVPGVLNGSKGPLYYPSDEIAKNYLAWNGMPIVLNHPTDNGNHVSARDPKVLDKFQIGQVFNSRINGKGKLQADAWFDVERTRLVDRRVLANLEAGKPIELSTGLFTDNEPAPQGVTFNGKPYSEIARNYVPDHLAVLPDQTGACSIKDGCGIMVNQKRLKVRRSFTVNPAWVEDEDLWEKAKKQADKGDYTDEQYYAVVTSIYEKMGGTVKASTKNAKHKRLRVKAKDQINNQSQGDSAMTEQEKKQIVDNLIANVCCWKETDRATLNTLSEETLKSLLEQGEKAKANEAVVNAAKEIVGKEVTVNAMPAALLKAKEKMAKEDEEELDEEGNPVKNKKPCANKEVKKEEPKKVTANEWLDAAPAEVQSVVRNAMRVEAEEKAQLIKTITANTNNPYKPEELNAMSVDQLRPIAKLAIVVEQKKVDPLPSFLGASVPFTTVNSEGFDRNDILPLPTMTYETRQSK